MTFDSLDSGRVIHAAFTRLGGISPRPWDSLNFGSTVGDEAKNVVVNRQRAFECLGLDYQSSFDVWQVHGRDIAIADAPRPPEVKRQKADIL
jgi:copper oxidase (laccase) domain-containing protein